MRGKKTCVSFYAEDLLISSVSINKSVLKSFFVIFFVWCDSSDSPGARRRWRCYALYVWRSQSLGSYETSNSKASISGNSKCLSNVVQKSLLSSFSTVIFAPHQCRKDFLNQQLQLHVNDLYEPNSVTSLCAHTTCHV